MTDGTMDNYHEAFEKCEPINKDEQMLKEMIEQLARCAGQLATLRKSVDTCISSDTIEANVNDTPVPVRVYEALAFKRRELWERYDTLLKGITTTRDDLAALDEVSYLPDEKARVQAPERDTQAGDKSATVLHDDNFDPDALLKEMEGAMERIQSEKSHAKEPRGWVVWDSIAAVIRGKKS